MCQYNDRCPTTKHRPGTVCPVEVRQRNEAAKARHALILIGVMAIGFGVYWLLIR